MLRLSKYLRPYLGGISALFVLVLIQVITNLQLPDYTAGIINKGIVNGDTAFILHDGLIMLAISLLGGIATIGVGYFAAKVATGFSMDVRTKVFERVESFALTEFNKFSTASLITRTTNDVQQVQMVVIMLLRLVVYAPILGVGAVIKAYHTAPDMSWIMALAVGVMFTVIVVLFSLVTPRFTRIQKLLDKLNLVTRENLTGLRVIRAFNTEHIEEQKFEAVNQDLTRLNVFVNRLMAIMQPVMMLIFNITSIGIVWVGAHLINSGSLQVGDMLAFMQYAIQTIMAFLFVSFVFIMVPRASVSGGRIADVIETKPSITDPPTPAQLGRAQGRVEFKDVSFIYPGADQGVLEHINFTAEPGQTTAFIGSTGSGKSTLVNLIPRFYDVTAGQILIDGVDIRLLKLTDLYQKIGYVPQRGVLFSGTIKENIAYGKPMAEQNEITAAAAIAQATEFITKLDQAYESPIAQGGDNLSGGQKQRLSIARAIIRQPEIYIFDDSFSALDFKTDAALRKALLMVTKAKTVLLVGQRISTIMHADKIVVLDEGKIVGIGGHRELLSGCQVYREIATSQLSEEELAKHPGKPGAEHGKLLGEGAL